MTYFIHQSKRLAYLLRHSSLPDTQGWMLIADLIARHGFTHELLKEIIYNDEFGRYEFSGDRSAVKARYGHTNHVHIKLPPAVPPQKLYHGTSEKAVDKIRGAAAACGLLEENFTVAPVRENKNIEYLILFTKKLLYK